MYEKKETICLRLHPYHAKNMKILIKRNREDIDGLLGQMIFLYIQWEKEQKMEQVRPSDKK